MRGLAITLRRPALLEELPDIDSDASTESEGEGGNTYDELSELDEFNM